MGAPAVARVSNNGVRVMRGRDTQTIPMGANGQSAQGFLSASANGVSAAGNAIGGAAPLLP